MQKKLIALAIAGLASAPVFAQTNVTVYGVVDVTAEAVAAKGASDDADFDIKRRARVTSNSSLIGFRGTEDLGNGLKALFQIESSIAADTGGGTLAGRDTFVGLTGGFGTLQLGKLTTIMRQAGAKVDFNPAATGIGFQGATYGTIGGVKTGIDERINNAVMYTSPNFSGFTVQAAYSAGENRRENETTGDRTQHSNAYQFAGAYENGPLYVSAGYALAKDLAGFNVSNAALTNVGEGLSPFGKGASDEMKAVRLAAKYTFPSNTSVSALWDRSKYEADSNLGDADVKRNAWLVGVEQKFGGNQAAYLQYSRSQKVKGDVCLTGLGCGDVSDLKTEFAQWTLGYTYALSKRTMVKAYYTRLNNDRDSDVDFYLSGIGGVSEGQDPNGFGLGLRHTF